MLTKRVRDDIIKENEYAKAEKGRSTSSHRAQRAADAGIAAAGGEGSSPGAAVRPRRSAEGADVARVKG